MTIDDLEQRPLEDLSDEELLELHRRIRMARAKHTHVPKRTKKKKSVKDLKKAFEGLSKDDAAELLKMIGGGSE